MTWKHFLSRPLKTTRRLYHSLTRRKSSQRGIIRNKRNIGRKCWRRQQSSRLLLLCGIGFVDETLSLHLIGIESNWNCQNVLQLQGKQEAAVPKMRLLATCRYMSRVLRVDAQPFSSVGFLPCWMRLIRTAGPLFSTAWMYLKKVSRCFFRIPGDPAAKSNIDLCVESLDLAFLLFKSLPPQRRYFKILKVVEASQSLRKVDKAKVGGESLAEESGDERRFVDSDSVAVSLRKGKFGEVGDSLARESIEFSRGRCTWCVEKRCASATRFPLCPCLRVVVLGRAGNCEMFLLYTTFRTGCWIGWSMIGRLSFEEKLARPMARDTGGETDEEGKSLFVNCKKEQTKPQWDQAKAWGMGTQRHLALPNRTQASWDQSFVHRSAGADLKLDLVDAPPWALVPHRPSGVCVSVPTQVWRHSAANVPPFLPLAASCKPSAKILGARLLDSCQTVGESNRLVLSCRHVHLSPRRLCGVIDLASEDIETRRFWPPTSPKSEKHVLNLVILNPQSTHERDSVVPTRQSPIYGADWATTADKRHPPQNSGTKCPSLTPSETPSSLSAAAASDLRAQSWLHVRQYWRQCESFPRIPTLLGLLNSYSKQVDKPYPQELKIDNGRGAEFIGGSRWFNTCRAVVETHAGHVRGAQCHTNQPVTPTSSLFLVLPIHHQLPNCWIPLFRSQLSENVGFVPTNPNLLACKISLEDGRSHDSHDQIRHIGDRHAVAARGCGTREQTGARLKRDEHRFHDHLRQARGYSPPIQVSFSTECLPFSWSNFMQVVASPPLFPGTAHPLQPDD
ncbi:hypothetical protein KCU61_g173, partial [Aureobasidium melanogenum]